MEYTLKRSKRKTIGLKISSEGTLIVHAPYNVDESKIHLVLDKHSLWIKRHLQKASELSKLQSDLPLYTKQDKIHMKQEAESKIIPRIEFYSRILNVKYSSVSFRLNKTRWGSANSKKKLSFNLLLTKTPDFVIDAIVVHELAHLIHMNHSSRFYDLVLKVYPSYPQEKAWLKAHGSCLLARIF